MALPDKAEAVFSAAPGGVSVRVRVTPKASRTGVAGIKDTPQGPALAVLVTVAPEDGKANAAVIKLLAKEWRVAKGAVAVTSGQTARDKILTVAGAPDRLAADLARWLEQFG